MIQLATLTKDLDNNFDDSLKLVTTWIGKLVLGKSRFLSEGIEEIMVLVPYAAAMRDIEFAKVLQMQAIKRN